MKNTSENRDKLARHVVDNMTVEQLRERLFQDLYEAYQDDDIFNSDWEDYLTDEDSEV